MSVAKRIVLGSAGIVALLSIMFLGLRFFFRTYRVTTAAMEPTLPRGAHIIARATDDPKLGDIVTFRYPQDRRQVFVKRIVAVGGDVVEIRSKDLIVNGIQPNERYVVHQDTETYPRLAHLPEPYRSRDHFGPYRVPAGHVFVMGDNRDRSYDSRYWGSVPTPDIIGHVVFLYSSERGYWKPDVPPVPKNSKVRGVAGVADDAS